MVCIIISVATTQKIIFVLKRKPGIILIFYNPLIAYTMFLPKNQKRTTAIKKPLKNVLYISTSKNRWKEQKLKTSIFFLTKKIFFALLQLLFQQIKRAVLLNNRASKNDAMHGSMMHVKQWNNRHGVKDKE